MSAPEPTIIASSGGLKRGSYTELEFGSLINYAIEVSNPKSKPPKVTFINTANGDSRSLQAMLSEAGRVAKTETRHFSLFPMPNVPDAARYLLDSDVIWVGGGSVANLLALWRLHKLPEILHSAWQNGVVLGGVSAGSICWHIGGTTDSFGPELHHITNGLGFIPLSNGVHYDTESQRRPKFQALIRQGVLPDGYATEDGVGLHYQGTALLKAVTEAPGKGAYRVYLQDDVVHEDRIEPELISL